MKTTTIALLTGLAFTAPAMAQTWTTTPNVYGRPEFGSTITSPGGQLYQTTPNIYGHPEFGSTATGPNGSTYEVTPNVWGHPELGSTMHRY